MRYLLRPITFWYREYFEKERERRYEENRQMSYMNRLDVRIQEICDSCQNNHCEECKIVVEDFDGKNIVIDGASKEILKVEEVISNDTRS